MNARRFLLVALSLVVGFGSSAALGGDTCWTRNGAIWGLPAGHVSAECWCLTTNNDIGVSFREWVKGR